MANVTVTFTITEFCLHTGISEEELNEIVGLGVVEPREIQETPVQVRPLCLQILSVC